MWKNNFNLKSKAAKNDDLSAVVKGLFPNFASSKIQQLKGNNGTPFIIDDKNKKYWLKLISTSQLEDVLRDVEKRALQEIKSPYVVELLDLKTMISNGQRFDGLLFNYIEGEDLETIFRQRKKINKIFSEEEVKKILIDVSHGIDAISSKGWVHQDIKQKNIRYDIKNDRYVILDLGIAYYSRSLELPTGKHNKDYASSEQAYASVDTDKISLITFQSDISQLGQLAYELLTFKNAFIDDRQHKLNFQRIYKGEYKPIKDLNPNVSDKLIKIIDTMLNPHPGYRFRSPDDLISSLKDQEYLSQSKFKGGVYFQVWKGPHGYVKNIEAVTNEVSGVVVSASQMPGSDCIDVIKNKKMELIFDPETHLLSSDINPSWHGGLDSFDWYGFPKKPDNFKTKTQIADFVAKVVQPQLELDVDYVMPPYFSINNPDSEWRNINGLFYYECLQYCRRIGFNKPVLCPIAVSEAVISVDRSRKELVDYYSQLPDLNAFFLRINAKDHNTTVRIIQATSKLIQELERHKPVILADSGTVVFGYFAKGLTSCVTSLVDSRRENDMSIKQTNKPDGGSYKEKFFVPKIMQFVKVDGDLPNLINILGSESLCACHVCKKIGFDNILDKKIDPNNFISRWDKVDRGNHFFCCISEWKNSLDAMSIEQKIEAYERVINNARKIYKDFKSDLMFNQIIKKEDCADWEVAFFT